MKSGNLNFLEPSGPLQACNGTALPFFYYVYLGHPYSQFSFEHLHCLLRYRFIINLNYFTSLFYLTCLSSHIQSFCFFITLFSPTRHLKKVKQSHYGPAQVLRVPGCRGSRISRQSAHEVGTFVSPRHQPLLPPGNIPGTHFC